MADLPNIIDSSVWKQCLICEGTLPATKQYFFSDKSKKDGLNGRCKKCDYARKRSAAGKQYNDIYGKAWRCRNPEYLRTYLSRVRSSQRVGNFTEADLRSQIQAQQGKCWWCGKMVGDDYQVDHRIPLSRGGGNGPDNIVAACRGCNLSKGTKMPWEWAGRLI